MPVWGIAPVREQKPCRGEVRCYAPTGLGKGGVGTPGPLAQASMRSAVGAGRGWLFFGWVGRWRWEGRQMGSGFRGGENGLTYPFHYSKLKQSQGFNRVVCEKAL